MACMLLLAACDNYLDIQPTGSVIPNSLAEYRHWEQGRSSALYPYNNFGHIHYPEPASRRNGNKPFPGH